MKDENTLIFTGRLTRDPEGSKTKGNVTVVKLGLALHATQEITYFFNVQGFDKLADFVLGNFKKGDPVLIRGYMRQREWIDETSKRKTSCMDVVAHRVQLLGTYKKLNQEQTSGQ